MRGYLTQNKHNKGSATVHSVELNRNDENPKLKCELLMHGPTKIQNLFYQPIGVCLGSKHWRVQRYFFVFTSHKAKCWHKFTSRYNARVPLPVATSVKPLFFSLHMQCSCKQLLFITWWTYVQECKCLIRQTVFNLPYQLPNESTWSVRFHPNKNF